jgi:hypothetical protein
VLCKKIGVYLSEKYKVAKLDKKYGKKEKQAIHHKRYLNI